MTSPLTHYLQNRAPAPRRNGPEAPEDFAARVLRGALAPPHDPARVEAVSDVLERVHRESPSLFRDRTREPEPWLAQVAIFMEHLVADGLAPAALREDFPEVAPGLRFRFNIDMTPLWAAAVLGAWAPHAEAAAEGAARFLRAAARWRPMPLPHVWQGPNVGTVAPLTDGDALQWWETNYSRWVDNRSGLASIFGAGSGCPVLEELALVAREEFGRAGLETPAFHPSPPTTYWRQRGAWGGVYQLVVVPALVWRALVSHPRRMAPAAVAHRLQRKGRIPWAELPDPFGPLAEIVAQGLVPLRASARAGGVNLGLVDEGSGWRAFTRGEMPGTPGPISSS